MKTWKILSDWITESGLRAVTVLSNYGVINGYVEVLPESRFYNMEYSRWSMGIEDVIDWSKEAVAAQMYLNDIEVHGGLTYSKMGDGEYMPSNNYWFGFDCNHAWDRPDYDLALEHFPENKEALDKYYEIMSPFAPDTSIRDLNYVESECEKLAKQLKDK